MGTGLVITTACGPSTCIAHPADSASVRCKPPAAALGLAAAGRVPGHLRRQFTPALTGIG
jgi:hypothetical protein